MAKKDGLSKSTLFKKTLPYILKEKKLFIITFFLSLLVAVLSASTPFITKQIVDIYLPAKDMPKIVSALIMYASIILVLVISRYLYSYLNMLIDLFIHPVSSTWKCLFLQD